MIRLLPTGVHARLLINIAAMPHLPRSLHRADRVHRLLAYLLSRVLAPLLGLDKAVPHLQAHHGCHGSQEGLFVAVGLPSYMLNGPCSPTRLVSPAKEIMPILSYLLQQLGPTPHSDDNLLARTTKQAIVGTRPTQLCANMHIGTSHALHVSFAASISNPNVSDEPTGPPIQTRQPT